MAASHKNNKLMVTSTSAQGQGEQSLYMAKIHICKAFTIGRKPSHIGLSIATNLRIRSRRGLQGITSKNKRDIKDALTLLEKQNHTRTLTLLTVTIPTVTQDELQALNDRWGEIVHRFIQRLVRELENAGIDAKIVNCTEIQPKRYYRYGMVAPHLHIVFKGRKTPQTNWILPKERVNLLWQRTLEAELGRSVDCSIACRIEMVRRSLTNYLSKYMSKGGEIIKQIKADGLENHLPTSWIGMTRNLRKEVDESVIPLVGNKVIELLEAIQSGIPGIVAYPIILEEYGGIIVGYTGYFTCPELHAYFS